MRMKKFCAMLAIALMLTGCSPPTSDMALAQSSASSISSTDAVSSDSYDSSTAPNTYLDKLSVYDFESAYALCVEAMCEFAIARKNKTAMDFSKYIVNEALNSHMEDRISDSAKRYADTVITKTGLYEVDFQDASVTGDTERIYLKIARGVHTTSGTGGNDFVEFIVEAVDGRLVISEWYEPIGGSYDVDKRGHINVKDDAVFWRSTE